MRRSLFVLAPLGFAAFAFACEDDPTNTGGPNLPEAGTFDSDRPDFDSSTPVPDAQPDAPVTPKGVTVVVTGRSGPKSGVTVVFHDAAGAVLETKQTGADGKATSAPSPTPAMATAVLGGDFNRNLLTWTGTEDGDELPAVVSEPGSIAVTNVTLPAWDGGFATYYAKIGGCTQNTTIPDEPLTLYVDPGCFRGAGGILIEARDEGDNAVGHTFKKPIALVNDGGTVAIDGLPGYAVPATVAVQVTGPAAILEGAESILHTVAGNTIFPAYGPDNGFMGNTGNNTTYERVYKVAPATFTEAINAAVMFDGTNQRIVGKRAPLAATVSLDANALPPELTGSSYDQTNPKRPIAKWTGATTGMRGGVVRIRFFDPTKDKATVWSIVVPAAGTEVTVPALPATLDDLLPTPDAGITWNGTPEVIFADSTLLVSGYATFRKVQGLVLPAFENDATVKDTVLPANGDFKITRWYQSFDR